jgi:hypothetical protein
LGALARPLYVMHRALYLLGWSYVALCTTLVARSLFVAPEIAPQVAAQPEAAAPPAQSAPPSGVATGAEWFRRMKPYCNSVEVTTVVAATPAPATIDGAGYHAACLALAGKIDAARRVIDIRPQHERANAAYIVFDVGHPVADAGDDRSAGPIMELVVDYVPTHYMALYHAGMAEYMLGQRDLAKKNLAAFLDIYKENDGWRSNALDVIARLNQPAGSAEDARRPREPL